MPRVIKRPSVIQAAGNKPKLIEEYVGRVNSSTSTLSVARMKSPAGWIEPGQQPEFTEVTFVLNGTLQVKTKSGFFVVHAGESIIAEAGEWVQYSTPETGGAEYLAICVPAFSPDTVHRDS